MNDAIERLRVALSCERLPHSPTSVGLVRARARTDAALDELAAAITPPVEVEAPADRRDEPVTLGMLERIVQAAQQAVDMRHGFAVDAIRDALREELR